MSFILDAQRIGLVNANSIEKQKKNLDHSTAKLSSGKRIIRAADDAAALSISTNLTAKTRSLVQARQNCEMALSFIQTSEGYLQTLQNNMVRMKELAMQSASDTINGENRAFVNIEFKKMQEANRHIVETARFGSVKILDGTAGSLDFQIGADNTEFDRLSLEMDVYTVDPAKIDITGDSNKISEGTKDAAEDGISTKTAAQNALGKLGPAIDYVSSIRANLGAAQNRISSAIANIQVEIDNSRETNSRMRDSDFAKDAAEKAKNDMLVDTSTAMMAHSNESLRTVAKLIV